MNHKTGFAHEFSRNRTLFLMMIPAVILAVLFAYIPMSGLVLAFKDFQYNQGVFGSPWCGLENFRFFFISGTGWRVTRNTILYNLLNLITSQFLAVAIAVVISEMGGWVFKRFSQSVIFLPYFISWVIVGIFVYNIFNYETGTFNSIMKFFGMKPVNFYDIPSAWIWIIMLFNSWKWAGYNSVIYIAAITNVDPACYEAAQIDGADVWQKIRYITMPSIKPTLITMILLNVGRILRGDFQMFYQIIGNNGQLYETTDVIDTFVFRSLLTSGDIGMTAAATFYQSVLCFIIIMVVNSIVKHVDEEYALF